MELSVRVPGSCGELIQGWYHGAPFLVTCPIERYTTVRVSDAFHGWQGLGEKSQRALSATLSLLGVSSFPWGMKLSSDLPRGKGMASSSADIAAVIAAASLALGRPLPPEEILRLAVQIEPTDATFFPGVVALDHTTGRVFQTFDPPPFSLALFDTDPQRCVDTVSFHEVWETRAGALPAHDWAGLLRTFGKGAQAAAAAATLSACWNEEILPKQHFEAIKAAADRVGAPGLVAAHSGTVIGVLLSRQAAKAAERLQKCLPHVAYLGSSRIISGGIFVEWPDGAKANFG